MTKIDLDDICAGCSDIMTDRCGGCLRTAIHDLVNGNDPVPDLYRGLVIDE